MMRQRDREILAGIGPAPGVGKGTTCIGGRHGIGGLDPMPAGIPTEREYLERYCNRTGRGHLVDAVMADWNFYMAYNLFRIAAILQGIAKRVVDGTASSAQARQAGAGARPMAELGWHFARRARA